MNRQRFELCLSMLVLASAVPTLAQAAQPPETAPLPPDDVAKLQRYRQIIENTADSIGTRRVQAEELLMTGWPAASEMAAELLGTGAHPSTRIAVCEAVAAVGAANPALLRERHSRLVDPLLRLLGGPADGVSARAAEALAAFPDGGVTSRLGELAGDADAPTHQRLAAVDALALSVYKRDVVRQLVLLLASENGEFRARVFGALRSASRQDFGTDVAKWQAWWEKQEATLNDAEWVLQRVKLFFQRLKESQRWLGQLRSEHERRYAALAERLTNVLRDNYRLIQQPAQKEETLTRWLKDPLVEFQLAALAIISEEIQDGNLPSDTVVAALIGELSNRSPEIRRAVLGIVGALNIPAKTGAVLALLEEEKEDSVRKTAFRVLGQLRNPDAIGTLITEISNPSAPSGCVAEAASALAILGAKGKVEPTAIEPVIPMFVQRFDSTPTSDLHLRESLLRAMAGIGALEFGKTFNEVLSCEQTQLLVPAIDGLISLGDAGSMDRLLTLTGHADPRVRETAVRAIGALGGESAHLEVLSGRLSPSAETNEAVRNAAWTAWRGILAGKKPSVRLQSADRLRESPERQITYLEELIKDFAGHNPPPPELNDARRRLATLHAQRGDPAAALPVWQQLYAALEAANDPQATEVSVKLLSLSLAAGRSDTLKDTLEKLSTAKPSVKAQAITVVTDHIKDQLAKNQPDALLPLVDAMLSLPLDEYGEAFPTYLRDVKRQLTVTTRPAHADATVTTAPATGD